MSAPNSGEVFARLIEHLRKASEAAYTLGHLKIDEAPLQAKGWRAVGENLENTVKQVTKLATATLRLMQ